jgi:hypothetical protein
VKLSKLQPVGEFTLPDRFPSFLFLVCEIQRGFCICCAKPLMRPSVKSSSCLASSFFVLHALLLAAYFRALGNKSEELQFSAV